MNDEDFEEIMKEQNQYIEELEAKVFRLERANEALEQLRPVWGQGYTNDSMAAQATASALSELWKMLNAKDQTHACYSIVQQQARIEELEAENKRLRLEAAYANDTTDAAIERINGLEAKLSKSEALLEKAVEALEECVEEIDAYIQHQYPHDHPVQERHRQRDYASNPARLAIEELTGGKDE